MSTRVEKDMNANHTRPSHMTPIIWPIKFVCYDQLISILFII